MKSKIISAAFLTISSLSHAGYIATAHGTITSGCDACSGETNIIFGDVPNLDLTGTPFTLEYHLTDELLAQTPSITPIDGGGSKKAGASIYDASTRGSLTASILINGRRYDEPFPNYVPQYWINTDGAEGFYTQYEGGDPTNTPGVSISKYISLTSNEFGDVHFTYYSDTTGIGSAGHEFPLIDTKFNGTIGEFTFVSDVPLPSAIYLLGSSLMCLLRIKRKRK